MPRSTQAGRQSGNSGDGALRLLVLMGLALAMPGAALTQERKGPVVSSEEYEGWRQYSVHCARCHGQDVLPNPVAANLLVSAGPGGKVASRKAFVQVVTQGRPNRGMPAFKGTLQEQQIAAIYAYVKGRADKRISPGRPATK